MEIIEKKDFLFKFNKIMKKIKMNKNALIIDLHQNSYLLEKQSTN